MRALVLAASLIAAGSVSAEGLVLAPETITEWKPVFGTVEPRNEVPARARIGGVIDALIVTEGDAVTAGQRIATVRDEKIGFQIAAFDAQIAALKAQFATAETELGRGQALVDRGVTTPQQLDQLRTIAATTWVMM